MSSHVRNVDKCVCTQVMFTSVYSVLEQCAQVYGLEGAVYDSHSYSHSRVLLLMLSLVYC